MVDEDLRRLWFEFDEADPHGCRLPLQCGVTAWNEADALALVADTYCDEDQPPTPRSAIADFDVSQLDVDTTVRPNIGVPAWRGIWYPFITTT